MSSLRVKTTYNLLGDYGSTEIHELACVHNNSCDIVSFYSDGECILTVEDTEKNNLYEAIQRLYSPFKDKWFGDLKDNVEYLSSEEYNKLKQ